uniref:CDC42 effector protein 1 n=1 Tax=Erpetoichthys calabaricus TaxID=27687 RepID=A0A8C4T2X9_ERPCA
SPGYFLKTAIIMSLGKLPVLKGFVSNSHNKRRYKSDLTVDMISPPLGDFRHTMHVGRGGDVFGDTSFLSNHGGGGGGGGGGTDTDANKSGGLFSRTLRHVRKTPGSRARGGSRELSPPPPAISPIIKNAISLPQLVDDTPNGGLQKEQFKSLSTSQWEPSSSFGEFSELQRSDSLMSFTLDLGPSLMSEVMELIERSEKILGQDAGEDHLSTSFRNTSISEVVESPSWNKPWQSPSHLEYSMSREMGTTRRTVMWKNLEKSQDRMEVASPRRAPFAYPEEEDEIKV